MTDIEMGRSFDYSYPMGLDFRPGSKLHQRIAKELFARAEQSKAEMSKRYPVWDKITDKLTCYMAPEDMDPRDARAKAKNPRTPVVIVPQAFAILDTILTYYINAFGDGVLFKYEPVAPEDKPAAKMLEHVVNNQATRSKMLLSMYIQWRDALAYGLGISHIRWHEDFGKTTKRVPKEIGFDPLSRKPITIEVDSSERIKTYEGSVLDNIHPRNYFPDTSLPCHKFQEGEFLSFISSKSYVTLLNMEQNGGGSYFNVGYLKDTNGALKLKDTAPENQLVHPDDVQESGGTKSSMVDVLHFYWTLIPSDWGLGKSVYPEKWLFEVAGEKRIIIRAQPMNLNHNKYPVAVCAPFFDGYTVAPVSLMELLYELQNAIDWLWRSRFRNVNAAMNNKIIIDPFLARYDQALDTESNVICIREHVWGRGVQNAMEHIPVPDVTQGHILDIGHLTDIMQRVSGAVDSIQGVVRPSGERRSATEMRDARMSALSRIQKGTRLASLQSMYDLGFFMGYHTQQFMSTDTYIKLIGESYVDLVKLYNTDTIKVTPEDIQLAFDVVPADAVTPGGEYLPDLINLFQLTSANPYTAAAYDPVKQTLDMYTRLGVKGAYQFLVMPEEQAMRQAQLMGAAPMGASNLQGMKGSMNAAPQ